MTLWKQRRRPGSAVPTARADRAGARGRTPSVWMSGALLVAAFAMTMAGAAQAATEVFDVDDTQSTFTAGSIDVEFTAVLHSTGIFGTQTSYGSATVMNAGYAADGTITLDTQAGQVTLDGLDVGGMVGASGGGTIEWAGILTLNFVYNIVEQALSLNAPLTMPLVGGAFSGTPNFEFSGVSDGQVTGIINYGIPQQTFGSSGNMPIDGTLTSGGGTTTAVLTASQMQIDLGASPTVIAQVNDCAFYLFGCLFYVTTADITVTSLIYNDVEMTLVGTAASAGPVCGDGNVDVGEECDDGNAVSGDGCSSTCTIEVCGNGVVDVGEACDDGNTVGGDGCSAVCEVEACGNGVVDVGEGCDDGNTVGGDGCSAVCQVEACGNGVLDVGEACDDGNTIGGDGCSAVCTVEACGNGVVDVGEGCDDGNTVGGDGCSAVCTLESCGNGVVDAGEGCDDGNTVGGDGCSAICQQEVCGNGVIDPGEVCDDGNVVDGDGCSSVCEYEVLVPGLGPWGAIGLAMLLIAAVGLVSSRRDAATV